MYIYICSGEHGEETCQELYEAKGRQIICKCEILKQNKREARKRIYHLGKLKKGHPKSRDVSNGNAATRRAESRSVWR